MVYLIGIGPGDPELLTLKAARLLWEADIVYVPRSTGQGRDARSVAEGIVLRHTTREKIRYVAVTMRHGSKSGTLEVYAQLAEEISRLAAEGKKIVFVTIGDSLLYSTAQYLGRELAARQTPHEYVPGIPAFIAAASHSGVALAGGRESLVVTVMPESREELDALMQRGDSLVLMKINKRLPLLLDYVRERKPEEARLLYRIGLEGEASYNLAEAKATPGAASGARPDVTSGTASGARPEAALGATSKAALGATSDVTPEEALGATSGATPDVTSEAASGVTSQAAAGAMPGATLGGMPESVGYLSIAILKGASAQED